MTITLELAQETEQTLRSLAEARGTSVANYVASIVARDVMKAEHPSVKRRPKNLVELGALHSVAFLRMKNLISSAMLPTVATSIFHEPLAGQQCSVRVDEAYV